MAEVLAPQAQPSWWASSSWFAGGVPLQEPAAQQEAAPASEPASPPTQEAPATDSLKVVGGAKAQSRFSGKTAIPIGTCKPLSSSGAAARALPPSQPQQARQQTHALLGSVVAAPAQPAPDRHAPWGGAAAGQTVDGSTPSAAGDSLVGGHVSRWVFDTRGWRWVQKGQLGDSAPEPLVASDKHKLAARRWGDGRDALGAAARHAATAQDATGGSAATASTAAAAAVPAAASAEAPTKRPRLQISAMTGHASDGGYASVGGLARQKEQLLEHIAYPLIHPRLFTRLGVSAARGVLLHGPPGSGKTHLVRALASEVRMPIVVLNGGECVGEAAEKNMRRAFNAAKSQQPCILLLDEVDSMAPSRASSRSEHERQATARLLSAIDELRASRCRVALVGTTSQRATVDAGLRRAGRLDCEVSLAALGQKERLAVLHCCTQRMPLHSDVDLAGVAASLRGYVGADVAAVASEAGLLCAVEAVLAADSSGRLHQVEHPEFLAGLLVTAAHFKEACDRLGPSVLRGLTPEVPDVSFEHIGGLEEAKSMLRELVEFPLRHGALLQSYGLPAPRGALLYGPPGCGKTLLAKAAAAQCGANFLSVRGPELLQKWLGESEAAVRQLFETARQAAPCLIFFDEVDSIAGRRGSGGSSSGGDAAASRVLNQLLIEMDGLSDRGGVYVLCATNRPEALDPALMRPGRLDHLLRVPLPDQPARLSILRSALRRCPLGADVALAELAGEPTLGMSGADVAEVCRRAGMAAIREMVAAEEAWVQQQHHLQQQQEGEMVDGGAQAARASSPPPVAPLQQRHLLAALATVRCSVSEDESQRHAQIEARMMDGSLPDPDEESAARRQQQQAVLQATVSAAVKGSVERQLSRLQQRVRQLEQFVRSAGLDVPEMAAVAAAEEVAEAGPSSAAPMHA